MRVLILVDVFGWAFHFTAQGIQKYSKHECMIKRWNEVTKSDAEWLDVLYCLNDSVWFVLGYKQRLFQNVPRKCLGIRGEEMPSNRILAGWTIGAVSKKIYDKLSSTPNLPIKGLYVTHNGVDIDIFKPIDRPEDRFVVGWAGNPTQPLKRFHLLRQINFPLAVQAKWGQRFFVRDRTRSEMLEFYKKIDCFVSVSSHEGMPQSILEAAATRLPIVATTAGGIPEFIDPEWLVDTKLPDKQTMDDFNYKLGRLVSNPQLRKAYGEANYQKVLSRWSWNIIVKEYDEMFDNA